LTKASLIFEFQIGVVTGYREAMLNLLSLFHLKPNQQHHFIIKPKVVLTTKLPLKI